MNRRFVLLLVATALAIAAVMLTACVDDTPIGFTPGSSEVEPEYQYEGATEPIGAEESSEEGDTATKDVMAQMVGFWRMDWPNPDNAGIVIIFADGRWESPGPLPTDITVGGSFVIVDEDSGIYSLLFTIEYTSEQTESVQLGHEIGNYRYDAQNDLFFSIVGSGEGLSTIDFIREG